VAQSSFTVTGMAESNGSLPPGGWLIVTCGLTACTPGSTPGPVLGNEYGKPEWKYILQPDVLVVVPLAENFRQNQSISSICRRDFKLMQFHTPCLGGLSFTLEDHVYMSQLSAPYHLHPMAQTFNYLQGHFTQCILLTCIYRAGFTKYSLQF